MEKKNEKLEAIRGEIPFKIKEQVDAWFDAIDRAYDLGCRDTEQKLNLSGAECEHPYYSVYGDSDTCLKCGKVLGG